MYLCNVSPSLGFVNIIYNANFEKMLLFECQNFEIKDHIVFDVLTYFFCRSLSQSEL